MPRWRTLQLTPAIELSAIRCREPSRAGSILRNHALERWRKRQIAMAPRDAISHVELARLYYLLGQIKSSQNHIERSVNLAPNNRFVIRCATRFFNDQNQPDRALDVISRSEAGHIDPWIQAAEAACADRLNKTPKRAIRQLSFLASSKFVALSQSELAVALATINFKQGGKSKLTRSLLRAGLNQPTENALAQALESSLRMVTLRARLPNATYGYETSLSHPLRRHSR